MNIEKIIIRFSEFIHSFMIHSMDDESDFFQISQFNLANWYATVELISLLQLDCTFIKQIFVFPVTLQDEEKRRAKRQKKAEKAALRRLEKEEEAKAVEEVRAKRKAAKALAKEKEKVK